MRWIIGDIHGMLDALTGLVDAVRGDDHDASFLFVGDYVNRGMQSRQVVDYLLALDRAQFCRGNHDDVFDYVVNNQCFEYHAEMPTRAQMFDMFLQYGLDNTLASYGIRGRDVAAVARKPSDRGLDELLKPIPQEHRTFFRHLPAHLDQPEFFVAHARWPIETTTSEPDFNQLLKSKPWLRHMILWGRFTDSEIGADKRWKRDGFFGHSPVTMYTAGGKGTGNREYLPLIGPNITLLDTAVALSTSGRLTAVCAETRDYIQTDRAGRKFGKRVLRAVAAAAPTEARSVNS
jgi:hypothetical protein